jgi:hypothetical protein
LFKHIEWFNNESTKAAFNNKNIICDFSFSYASIIAFLSSAIVYYAGIKSAYLIHAKSIFAPGLLLESIVHLSLILRSLNVCGNKNEWEEKEK